MAEKIESEKPLTEAERKKVAVQAYYDCKTPAERAAVIAKYPFLSETFSAGN